MTYTKLIYGTLVAATLVGGTVWYLDAPRSTLKAIDAYTLAERVLAIKAVVQGDYNYQPSKWPQWPFSNSVTTNVGWYVTTNTLTATNWSFNGYTKVPLFGSVIPRAFVNETLAQLIDFVPYFVDRVETNYAAADLSGNDLAGSATNSHINIVRHTVTGLWARLGIGDGTNLWTVGYTSNNTPIYGTAIGSVLSTTTLNEAWSVATNLTKTEITAFLRFDFDYANIKTVSEPSIVDPFAPVYPAAYSDAPANTDNVASYYLQQYNNYWGGLLGLFVEGIYTGGSDTNVPLDYARLEGTGVLYVASFPTNIKCFVTTWVEKSFPVPYGFSGSVLWSIEETRTNSIAFDGLDTDLISTMAVPVESLGNWGDYLTSKGVTITNRTPLELMYAVDTTTLAEWDFGD